MAASRDALTFPYDNGPWTVRGARTVFDNPWIRVVDHDAVGPDGAPRNYGVVRFKNRAIGVLPIDADGRVPLVGQHRFPLERYSWELPEGGGPLDEAPLAAAQRELAEETGARADKWLELAAFDLSNAVTDEVSICYLAWDLTWGPADPDPDERLQVELAPFAELHERVLAGDVRDALTIVMALTAREKAARGALPADVAALLLGGSK